MLKNSMIRSPERTQRSVALGEALEGWSFVCDGVYATQTSNGIWLVKGHESDLLAALENGAWEGNLEFRAALDRAYRAAEREFHF